MQANNLLRLLWLISVISLIACKPAYSDQLTLVAKTKRLVERLEECVTMRAFKDDHSVDLQSRNEIDSEFNIKCENASLTDITKVNLDGLRNETLLTDTLNIARSAIKASSSFYDIATYVEEEMNKPGRGDWLVLVSNLTSPERKLESRFPSYLDISIGLLRMKIFNISSEPSNNEEEQFDLNNWVTKAIEQNDMDAFKYIFDTKHISTDHKFADGKSFLHLVIESTIESNNRLSFVKYLIESKRMDPNIVDNQQRSAIHYAASRDLETLIYLVSKGGDVNKRDSSGFQAVHYAIISKQLPILKHLIEKLGVDPRTRITRGYELIHFACNYGCDHCVEYLVSVLKIDPNTQSDYLFTPLHEAAKSKNIHIVKFLVDRANADLNIRDYENKTALESAKEIADNGEIVEFLTSRMNQAANQSQPTSASSTIDSISSTSTTTTTTQSPSTSATVELIRENLTTTTESASTSSMNTINATSGVEAISDLMREENSLNLQTNLLHSSAAQNSLSMVKWLIEKKNVNPNELDSENRTPAAAACSNNSLSVLKYLLEEQGSNRFAKDVDGNSLVHISAANNAFETLRYLIENQKLDPNGLNNFRQTPLIIASTAGHMRIVRYLVESGKVDLNAKTEDESTPLILAANNNHFEIVKYLVSHGSRLNSVSLIIETVDNAEIVAYLKTEILKSEEKENGFELMSWLMRALENNELHRLRYIFEIKHANPNHKFKQGKNFLHLSIEHNRLNMVKYLIESIGLNPDIGDNELRTSVHYAASRDLETVIYLASKGADINKRDSRGFLPVHYAIISKQLPILKHLIEHLGVDKNTSILNGYKLIHFACNYGCDHCVEYLVSVLKIDPNTRSDYLFTPLHEAAKSKNIHIVKFLVEHANADLNALDYENKTALQSAEEIGDNGEVVEFLRLKMNVTGVQPSSSTTITPQPNSPTTASTTTTTTTTTSTTTEQPSLSTLSSSTIVESNPEELITSTENSSNITEDKVEETPFDLIAELTDALRTANLTKLQYIIEIKNTPLNHKFQNENTFLHYSCDFNRPTFVKYLVVLGANINARDVYGRVPLHYCGKRSVEITKYLIEQGAHPNPREDVTANQPIHFAASEGNVDVLRYLIENKISSPNSQNIYGFKPLHYSSAYGRLDAVKYLVENNLTDINTQSNFGYTPLREATYYRRLPIVKFLMQKGANPHIADLNNQTPIKIARTQNDNTILRALNYDF